jgi:alpha-amylase
MKRLLLLSTFTLITSFSFAKSVKFAVDMSTFTISPFGIHIMGDFQAVAGFTLGNWQSNTTPMTQVGSTTIYTVVVNVPAFQHYEFKFVNGDQSYEAEFVPYESRVEPYGFNDNRWIYVDSLANDTTYAGAIIFGANAPAGKTLMRFMVDMSNAGTISSNGVHVAGNFQASWDPTQIRMHSFGGNIYEIISYTTTGTYEYKFYNGKTLATSETVPGSCAVNNNRGISLLKDSILPTICFSSCAACAVGISEAPFVISGVKLYPNPTSNTCILEMNESKEYSVRLNDHTGREVRSYSFNGISLVLNKEDLAPGIYFASVSDKTNASATLKLVIQ